MLYKSPARVLRCSNNPCVESAKAIARLLRINPNRILKGPFNYVVNRSRNGIFEVLNNPRIAHYAVKVGDKIYDPAILVNIRAYNLGRLPAALSRFKEVDTFTVEGYTALRETFLYVLRNPGVL